MWIVCSTVTRLVTIFITKLINLITHSFNQTINKFSTTWSIILQFFGITNIIHDFVYIKTIHTHVSKIPQTNHNSDYCHHAKDS